MTLPPVVKLPLRIKLGHGFGSVVYGVKDNGFSTLLMLFYNQALGLDAGMIGLILLIALLLDALIDPIVGYGSDKTHTRWGQRHPWIYAAILPMALCWVMIWNPPSLKPNELMLYLLLFAFLMRASVSCFEVPSLSIVPALSADYDERTSITRWRFLFAWAGGLVMLMLAFGVFLVPETGYPVGLLNVRGYNLFGISGAILIVIAGLSSALTTHRRLAHLQDVPPTHLPLGETLREMRRTLSNRPYLILLASTLFTYINLGMSFSIAIYALTYFWEVPQSGFLAYSVTLFLGVVGAFFLIGFLQSRIEKRTGAVVTGIIAISMSTVPYVLRFLGWFPENGTPALMPTLLILVTISNAFAVCAAMLGQSMGSDVIEASQMETGKRSEGIFFAGYFFTQKCATGVGLFITGRIISLSGFPAKAKPGEVPAPILDQLVLYYMIVLVLLGIGSVFAISRFSINRADHEERLRQLAQKVDVAA